VSWDGIYRAKVHYGKVQEVTACRRRAVRKSRLTTNNEHVTCFACLKKLGAIK
jgi:hypothetical protein